MTSTMTPGVYFLSEYALEASEQAELSAALEDLGLKYKPAQLGGASTAEIIDVVVCWISLRDVLTGAASGLLVLTIDKAVQAVRQVVARKDPAPGTRRKAVFSIYDDGSGFQSNVQVDLDNPLSVEALQAGLEAARQAHIDFLESQERE